MSQKIGYIALVVRDYDEAIAHYTGTLRFNLIEDTDLGGGKRWVLVAPPGSTGMRSSSPARRIRSKRLAWATRPAAAYSCSCIPTTSGATLMT